jgi:hypothetical protein
MLWYVDKFILGAINVNVIQMQTASPVSWVLLFVPVIWENLLLTIVLDIFNNWG